MMQNPFDGEERGNPVDPQLRSLLQGSLPVAPNRLQRDLWPQMQARLAERKSPVLRLRLKWWEWVLAAGDIGALYYAPDAIPALLYHL
jgi:hypothetical protein